MGRPDAVQALIAWAGRGPIAARVQRVEVQEADVALLHLWRPDLAGVTRAQASFALERLAP